MKRSILKNQKRVTILKRRTTNIGITRDNRNIICLVAKRNHRITEEELKSIKLDISTPIGLTLGKLIKLYHIHILLYPNKILTQKGILVRMGGGKSKIRSKVIYVTPGMKCIILIPKVSKNSNSNLEIKNPALEGMVIKILKKFLSKYTYLSILYLNN